MSLVLLFVPDINVARPYEYMEQRIFSVNIEARLSYHMASENVEYQKDFHDAFMVFFCPFWI